MEGLECMHSALACCYHCDCDCEECLYCDICGKDPV